MNSAIAVGEVRHDRLRPPRHRFRYAMHMLALDLDELPELASMWRRPWFGLRRRDYLGQGPLKAAVLDRMSELSGQRLEGRVLMLCQIRCFGIYFSPVNFYLLDQGSGWSYLLAEVSNTPWNERHCYLVPLSSGERAHSKAFHVSPFMPMALDYHWTVRCDEEQIRIGIDCRDPKRQFFAEVNLKPEPLNPTNLRRVIRRTPMMSVKILAGIYLEAIKLWRKGARFHPHPKQQGVDP
ncbi:DUF1365 domain-containing protein [Ferrimonas gelatinilytica]|uniref:DUF1365 domain-containing protein n=1 Tax=Ferrimonas gelatinilytica TaxID=1255257 RepID=A0ABP9S4B1_9GAMM